MITKKYLNMTKKKIMLIKIIKNKTKILIRNHNNKFKKYKMKQTLKLKKMKNIQMNKLKNSNKSKIKTNKQ